MPEVLEPAYAARHLKIGSGFVGAEYRRGDPGASMANESMTSMLSVGTSNAGGRPSRPGDGLMVQLVAVLSKALNDVSSLEVRTFTSEAADAALAATGDPLAGRTKLRAFTRISVDGDTQICVPLRPTGEPDEALWKLHSEAVASARDDRAKTIASVIAIVKELGGSSR